MGRAKICAILIGLAACGCARQSRIVVGSKNFTEQLVLGEIIARHLEKRLGVTVERKLNLGGTLLAHQALINGEIDLYPEYTGTALMAVLKLPPASDSDKVFQTVRKQYRERFQVDWMEPLGFENTFAIVIRGEDARTRGIETLSEAQHWQPGWNLGAGYEFQHRSDGLPALSATYSIRFSKPPRFMDLGLLHQALTQNQVDMVAASSTDGMLSKLDVLVLGDDRHAFPPYQAGIAVRQQSLKQFPALAGALRSLSGRFSEQQMRRLNYLVDVEHRPLAEVAAGFLESAGIE
jgi:osmoprotectant transport system substrate-binding protein